MTWILANESGDVRNTNALREFFYKLLSEEDQSKATELGLIPLTKSNSRKIHRCCWQNRKLDGANTNLEIEVLLDIKNWMSNLIQSSLNKRTCE